MSKQNVKCYEYYVDGMHCAACEMLIEGNLAKNKNVKSVKASLAKNSVIVETTEDNKDKLREELTGLVSENGYTLLNEKSEKSIQWRDFLYAIPFAFAVIIVFLVLQKLGIAKFSGSSGNYAYVFLNGIIASLSTCSAVVGGIVLSLSSTSAKESKNIFPHLSFHGSRVISFFIFGGLLGLVGSVFEITPSLKFIITTILVLVMVILAINLMEVLPGIEKFQLRLPKFLSQKHIDRTGIFAPLLLGALTFIIPCGFTQTMQIQALQSGNFSTGALTMFIFALGTLPVLLSISFASVKFAQKFQSTVFFKTAGLIIIFFAILNLLGALATIGVITPLFNI